MLRERFMKSKLLLPCLRIRNRIMRRIVHLRLSILLNRLQKDKPKVVGSYEIEEVSKVSRIQLIVNERLYTGLDAMLTLEMTQRLLEYSKTWNVGELVSAVLYLFQQKIKSGDIRITITGKPVPSILRSAQYISLL